MEVKTSCKEREEGQEWKGRGDHETRVCRVRCSHERETWQDMGRQDTKKQTNKKTGNNTKYMTAREVTWWLRSRKNLWWKTCKHLSLFCSSVSCKCLSALPRIHQCFLRSVRVHFTGKTGTNGWRSLRSSISNLYTVKDHSCRQSTTTDVSKLFLCVHVCVI